MLIRSYSSSPLLKAAIYVQYNKACIDRLTADWQLKRTPETSFLSYAPDQNGNIEIIPSVCAKE